MLIFNKKNIFNMLRLSIRTNDVYLAFREEVADINHCETVSKFSAMKEFFEEELCGFSVTSVNSAIFFVCLINSEREKV